MKKNSDNHITYKSLRDLSIKAILFLLTLSTNPTAFLFAAEPEHDHPKYAPRVSPEEAMRSSHQKILALMGKPREVRISRVFYADGREEVKRLSPKEKLTFSFHIRDFSTALLKQVSPLSTPSLQKAAIAYCFSLLINDIVLVEERSKDSLGTKGMDDFLIFADSASMAATPILDSKDYTLELRQLLVITLLEESLNLLDKVQEELLSAPDKLRADKVQEVVDQVSYALAVVYFNLREFEGLGQKERLRKYIETLLEGSILPEAKELLRELKDEQRRGTTV